MKPDQVSLVPDPIEGDSDRHAVHVGAAREVLTLRTRYQGRAAPAVIFNLCGPFPIETAPAIAEALLELALLNDRLSHASTKKGKNHAKVNAIEELGTDRPTGRRHGSKPSHGPDTRRRGRP